MSAGQGKSLTTPPENLKEAIDWVLRVSGRDNNQKDDEAIKGLAGTLQAMLNGDPGVVKEEVKEKFGEVSKSVMENFSKSKTQIYQTSERGFAVPHGILHKFSKGLEPFPSGSAAISREKAERWALAVREETLQNLIKDLANGLKKFVAPTSGIVQGSVASAYKPDAKWESLQAAERKDCAIIFLAILPLLYIAVTYLYWRCSLSNDSSEPFVSWSGQRFNSNKGLKKYMAALGYTEKDLNESEKGQDIASHLQSAFSTELSGNVSSQDYPDFLEKLQKPLKSSLPSPSHPLTSLYFLSYYYITYPLHDVQSTSPASPSFTGYSGLSALAGGAYGLNLGGLGTFMGALLA
ncbi:variant erythrocyte surface antigen-1 family protein [Babesia caballi]|uniref:Variant erythrocyte surface antigen-1 family protein n=1 Tax=Babesia caballi TaxID=5871 RepID=A0AAV4LWK3_BABCB|nr:variant erythrocyte surface antigen-1 family protein [Babesia caballi]